ncbi:Mup1p [Ascoidea rubescens DSM 1968]|uniref:High affinity methionine permease n=1 Tax=Ascoidea rubescens DSM 1968 TaxID=1344418 RepID=A0A1D2VR18_9ASCO|nr:high affinity methionine permease [Ascoidea rubescens DSM 1968]ODV64056.1 high affinity methionine permease [Ascoidea rubescens DSM 1968]
MSGIIKSNSSTTGNEQVKSTESFNRNLSKPEKLKSLSDIELNVIELDQNKKNIGYVSAVFLILNRVVGTGIFSVTSSIYLLSLSVGATLLLWAAGSIIALAGLYVYMEFGSAIPRNGGEKNYLEYIFHSQKFLITSMYASYVLLLGWAAGNSIVAGEYLLNAAGQTVTQWNSRGIGIAVITFAFLVHSANIKAGLYLQNFLGLFKIGIIAFISVTGWVALGGGIKNDNFQPTGNFSNAFDGPSPTGYGIVTSLYNVIWSFIGYSNVNYALGEVRNPTKTLKTSAPIAIVLISIIYMFVNIAYFAVVPKEEIGTSGRILAGSFFRFAFGETAEKASSVFVGLSAVGNVLSVIFSQGRIVQQLGREGVLPFSSFFASTRPFNTPATGLFEHWLICVITIVAPPPGDAYNFVMNLISYPLNVINTAVAFGLLYIHYKDYKQIDLWKPPIRTYDVVILFFGLASLYLIIAPYIPPDDGQNVYNDLPYWIHPVVTWGVFGIGVVYYLVWGVFLPKRGGYYLAVKEFLGEDGFWRNKIFKIPNGENENSYIEQHRYEND